MTYGSDPLRLLKLFAGLSLGVLVVAGIAVPDDDRPGLTRADRGAWGNIASAAGAEVEFDRSVQEPAVDAHAYLVRLVGDDTPILERRSEKQLPPASLTKVLTALVAIELVDSDERITFSAAAKAAGEKLSRARPGERFLRDDALRFLMVESANDAAMALAAAAGERLGGTDFDDSVARFVRSMNRWARERGLTGLSIQNPTGLDAPGHTMSARDIATIAEYVWYTAPQLWSMSRARDTAVVSESGAAYALAPTNELLMEFPALRGGKTGLTDNARGALVLLYPARDRTAIIVILGSGDRFGDGRALIRWIEAAFR